MGLSDVCRQTSFGNVTSEDTTQLDSDRPINDISLVYCCFFSLHSNYLFECLLDVSVVDSSKVQKVETVYILTLEVDLMSFPLDLIHVDSGEKIR